MGPIVCVSATNRPENYTSLALAVVGDELRRRRVPCETFDGRDLMLSWPGSPATEDAKRLKAAIKESTGVVLATPEYHGGFSAMAKLVIENLGFPSALSGKPLALLGVAGGRIGAIKSLEQLRSVCSHVGAVVLPGAVSVAGVRRAFDDTGKCTEESVQEALQGLATSLLTFVEDYVCPKNALEDVVRGEGGAWTSSV